MEKRPSAPKAPKFTVLNLGTAGFIVAYLVFAFYAITYLVSH